MPRSMVYNVDVDVPAAVMYRNFTAIDYWQDLVAFYEQNAARTEIAHFSTDDTGTDVSFSHILSAQDLPGNVRQLENLCHWLSVMAPGMNVEVNDLPPELRGETTASAEQNWLLALERVVEQSVGRGEQGIIDQRSRDFERTLIVKALQHTGGRRIEAATLLGLGRNTLTRKIQELGLEEKAPAAG